MVGYFSVLASNIKRLVPTIEVLKQDYHQSCEQMMLIKEEKAQLAKSTERNKQLKFHEDILEISQRISIQDFENYIGM